jgi:hypothetical protein
MDIGPLEELATLNACGEVLLAEEVIRLAIHLPVSRGTRGSRDRQAEVRPLVANARNQRALPRT